MKKITEAATKSVSIQMEVATVAVIQVSLLKTMASRVQVI